jgi:uncharacterized protein (TIGR03084 family)
LDSLVADIADSAWSAATPAAGWTVGHQIAHLNWTDRAALLAITHGDGFFAPLLAATGAQSGITDPLQLVDGSAAAGAARPPAELLREWRAGRAELAAALAAVPPGQKIAWFGPPMSATSMATARIMETWAHGKDVADALGVIRLPTARLRHIAHIGVRTRDFAHAVNGLPVPAHEFRIELAAPDGTTWAWGPPDAAGRVRGSAEHFCLLVTQRANRADLDLKPVGAEADRWLSIAQAFAGPPGSGREPGGRS